MTNDLPREADWRRLVVNRPVTFFLKPSKWLCSRCHALSESPICTSCGSPPAPSA